MLLKHSSIFECRVYLFFFVCRKWNGASNAVIPCCLLCFVCFEAEEIHFMTKLRLMNNFVTDHRMMCNFKLTAAFQMCFFYTQYIRFLGECVCCFHFSIYYAYAYSDYYYYFILQFAAIHIWLFVCESFLRCFSFFVLLSSSFFFPVHVHL